MSLDVRDIRFGYVREEMVLDGFSASFPFGKITALKGENGAGKSTLSRIIMGILKPFNGEILVDGERINDFSLAERGRLIGYVMQNPARQIFSATCEEEIRFGLLNKGLSEEEVSDLTETYLDIFELSRYRDTMPFELSGGEQQRLVLAAILAMKPRYLILDEPTAGLDSRRKAILGKLLLAVRDECGIVVITHDRRFIEEYCEGSISL